MKKLLFLITLVTNSNILFCQAYSIDDYFKAYFPGKPIYLNSISNSEVNQVSYSYTDEENVIFYNGTYSILKAKVKVTDSEKFLNNFLNEHAASVSGKVIKKEFVKHDDNFAIIYFIKYKQDEEAIDKYGITVIKNKTIYNWAVQEILNYSKLKAKKIFNNNMKYFKILK